MNAKVKNESPLRIPMRFDDAIKHALTVAPPPEGWAEYEKKLKKLRRTARKRRKSSEQKK